MRFVLTTRMLFQMPILLMFTVPAFPQDVGQAFEGEMLDAWLQGKVETMLQLNRHLNGLQIDSRVIDGVVELDGQVPRDVHVNLASELVQGIEGVERVNNNLQVTSGPSLAVQAVDSLGAGSRKLYQWVDDVTTTASVKTKLLGNTNTKGLSIDVDTQNDVVTLSGKVESELERQMAGDIAQSTSDVLIVHNYLEVIARSD